MTEKKKYDYLLAQAARWLSGQATNSRTNTGDFRLVDQLTEALKLTLTELEKYENIRD